jgi:uncharacterized NAD-dependent epimerase/dehydratase family protein
MGEPADTRAARARWTYPFLRHDGRRMVILAEGGLEPMGAKTAAGLLRYRGDEVVAVVDSRRAGATVADCVGFGPKAPVVETVHDALSLDPDLLVIGIAPIGGILPREWRDQVASGLRAGLDVWSGLHTFLAKDEELSRLAEEKGCTVWDVRDPPGPQGVARPDGWADAHVVYVTGTDCSVGKMTTAVELTWWLGKLGKRAAFVPTGQTGVMLAGWGIAVDRVVSDFVAGAAQSMVREAAREADYVVVEGQGSLLHPAYSGVTLGLVHGTGARAMVLCHYWARTEVEGRYGVAIPDLREVVTLYETAGRPVRETPVVAVSLNTCGLPAGEACRMRDRIRGETVLPVVDSLSEGMMELAEAVVEHFEH